MFYLFSCLHRGLASKPNLVFSLPLCTDKLETNFSNNFERKYYSSYLPNDAGDSKKVPCKLEAVQLKSRSLIRLQGPDTLPLLQGLMTNDISHFENRSAIYSLFLNTQGRVLWDTILYHVKQDSDSKIFVECDSSVKNNLINHLKIFKLRKKVDIVDVEGDKESAFDLWTVFDHGHTTISKELAHEECCGTAVPQSSKRPELPFTVDSSLKSFGDPRLNELGWRVFVPKAKSSTFLPKDVNVSDEASYRRLRYTLGVAEGVSELPSANCFPLESNGDYLHGVSFHKGCYIGQELTARTHHTGVVRKRIMPFRLQEGNLDNVDVSTLQLETPSGKKSLGKVRGVIGSVGIGLIRIDEALAATELQIQNFKVQIERPFWWPVEASREKQTRQ